MADEGFNLINSQYFKDNLAWLWQFMEKYPIGLNTGDWYYQLPELFAGPNWRKRDLRANHPLENSYADLFMQSIGGLAFDHGMLLATVERLEEANREVEIWEDLSMEETIEAASNILIEEGIVRETEEDIAKGTPKTWRIGKARDEARRNSFFRSTKPSKPLC